MTTGNQYKSHVRAKTAYTVQGGDLHIGQDQDHFANGEESLRRHLYLDAAQSFEKYLGTARPDGNGSVEKVARGHFLAAIALLDRTPPRRKSRGEINRITGHLEQARELAANYPVYYQASVLEAIVKESYYEADGQDMPGPSIAELLAGVHHLSTDGLEVFVKHMPRVATPAWRSLAEHALELGVELEMPDEVAPLKVDRKRPEAVRKYFIKTPEPVTRTWAVTMLTAGLIAIIAGLVLGGTATVVLLFAGGFLLFLSAARYINYLGYLQAFDQAEPKPTDQQMHEWLQRDLDVLTNRAAQRLRLNTGLVHHGGDLLVQPLTVVGIPTDEDYLGRIRKVQVRKGQDGKLRANAYDVYILFLSHDQISTYQCLLDFETGHFIYDIAYEHHYRDVVSVYSASVPIPKNLLKAMESEHGIGTEPSLAELAAVSVTSGHIFEINIGIASRGQRQLEVAWRNKYALNILKKMIREHHNR